MCLFADEILALKNGILSILTRGKYSTSGCKGSSLFLPPLLSLRRRRRKTFPVSNLWFGYQEEELLETAHGDSYRFEKSSVSTLSISLCTQGQSQVTHEGKASVY